MYICGIFIGHINGELYMDKITAQQLKGNGVPSPQKEPPNINPPPDNPSRPPSPTEVPPPNKPDIPKPPLETPVIDDPPPTDPGQEID
jgi:hypothetical protein